MSNILCILWFIGMYCDIENDWVIAAADAGIVPACRVRQWIWEAYLHLARGGASAKGEELAKGLFRLRALLPHRDYHLQTLSVRLEEGTMK